MTKTTLTFQKSGTYFHGGREFRYEDTYSAADTGRTITVAGKPYRLSTVSIDDHGDITAVFARVTVREGRFFKNPNWFWVTILTSNPEHVPWPWLSSEYAEEIISAVEDALPSPSPQVTCTVCSEALTVETDGFRHSGCDAAPVMASMSKPRRSGTRRAPKSPEEREKELKTISDTLADGVAEIHKNGEWLEYLAVAARFHNYSLNNIILAVLQCGQRGMKPPTRLGSFKMWKDLGRNVRKGEKGLKIFAPIMVKLREGDEGYDPSVEKEKLVGFRPAVTFDYQQTDGKDLPNPPKVIHPTGEIPAGCWDSAVRYAGSLGFPVSIGSVPLGVQGFTDPNKNHQRIVISEILENDAQKMVTLFHEIAHVLLHQDGYDYDRNRGEAEVEAESVSFIVSTYFGIDVGDESFSYITGWSPDPDTLTRVGGRIMSTVRKIIKSVEPDVITDAPVPAPEAPAPDPAPEAPDGALTLF
jgi:antirestriction protein ArdC